MFSGRFIVNADHPSVRELLDLGHFVGIPMSSELDSVSGGKSDLHVEKIHGVGTKLGWFHSKFFSEVFE